MARPRIDIDIAEVERLAGLGLTQGEICLALGISDQTLLNRKRDSLELLDAIKRGKAAAASVVSSKLMELIDKGDLGAIVWYEKTRRGLSDKVQQETSGTTTIKVVYGSDSKPPEST